MSAGSEGKAGRARKRHAHLMEIDPSGRPLKRAGFEAAVALGLIVLWVVAVSFIFFLMRTGLVGGGTLEHAGPSGPLMLAALAILSWAGAEIAVGRFGLIWPGSAFGLIGPLSLGFAIALSTPELRVADHWSRVAIVSSVAGMAMVPFLFRFRLPGLVSPIMTFSLVGFFLFTYGADAERIRQMEGFSPRGIVAALLDQPVMTAVFGVLAVAATWYARRLDMSGENFGLAAARPLHLVGGGIAALVAGRLLLLLPTPLDAILLVAFFVAITVWTLRVNRVAVAFAGHFAMGKPMVLAITEPMGLTMGLEEWVQVFTAILLFDLLSWPWLHRLSQRLGWTLGPGGRVPPDRPGIMWRYWPYATEEGLDRWAAERAERKARRAERRAGRRAARMARRLGARASRATPAPLSGGIDPTATDPK